jgi:hypothetical protein
MDFTINSFPMIKKLPLLFFICIAASTIGKAQQHVQTGQQVIESMFRTYKGKWYKNLTFTQKTVFYKQGQPDREEIWYEAMDMTKGGLIIKFNSMHSGNGIIFESDSMFVYKDNERVSKSRRIHELIVLRFSVYIDKPEVTISKLTEAGFDMRQVTTETVHGKLQYVVGNPEQAQFWIDTETMLLTKLRKKQNNGRFSEIHFNGYQKLAKAWIETEVVFYTDGQIMMKELYTHIKTPKKLPPSFYVRTRFSEILW